MSAHVLAREQSDAVRAVAKAGQKAAAAAQVDVIIRTLADRSRAAQLDRAINSVLSQEGVAVRLHVVVNGERFDPEILAELRRRDDLVVHYMKRASAGAARMLGRRLVEAPYFLYLDDDDELMPYALAVSLLPMKADPDLAVVVTNGYYISAQTQRTFIPDLASAQSDPLAALLRRAWMASCGALFNTAFIGPELFEPEDLSYHEWTLLAFRIALSGAKIRFLDLPAYNIYDTSGSMSKTMDYIEGELRTTELMRSYRMPRRVRRQMECKYRNVLHVLADAHRHHGSCRAAWRFHLQSLKPPSTLRYLFFTRKLLTFRAGRSPGSPPPAGIPAGR